MKVGSFCYATDQGLGYLARSFYRAGVVTDAVVVKHPSRPTHLDWFPGSQIVNHNFSISDVTNFCHSVDTMLFFETPFNWSLIEHCRKIGVKTFLMPMYECTPKHLPATPDFFLCPSKLDLQYFKQYPSCFLPVPVEGVHPYRERKTAELFVHNAGNGGLLGRNGTAEVFESLKSVKSTAKFLIRYQKGNYPIDQSLEGRIETRKGTQPHESLYDEGDIFLFPEKFNGLSLPLQEAFAAGMSVMATNRFPMNDWLPNDLLIPPSSERVRQIGGGYLAFNESLVDPVMIADQIDTWYGRDISEYSKAGLDFRNAMSWEKLKPQYLEVLH